MNAVGSQLTKTGGAIAVITARGGSKGLPRKNVLPLAGVPLIVHTVRAAKDCSLIDACYVSTDDLEIAGIAQANGVEVIPRPADLAGDMASSVDVILHALAWLEESGRLPEILVLLQPTSPLRTADHLCECMRFFLASTASSTMSVTPVDHHPFKMLKVGPGGMLEPMVDADSLSAPRQKLPEVLRQNGAIYAVRVPDFRRTRSFFIPPVLPYRMRPEESIDIDSALDLQIAALVMEARTVAGQSH